MRAIQAVDRLVDGVLLVFFAALFLVGSYTMYDAYLVYDHAQDSSLLAYKPSAGDAAPMERISEDAVAWLTIDETSIDYPVMQGVDNSEYLNKDPFGAYSLSGSIFLDARNDPAFGDPYSLVYGHHMEHGAMFGALDEFLDGRFFTGHRTGTLVTADGVVHAIRLFAVAEADASVEQIFAPTETSGTLDYVAAHASIYDPPADPERVIALSTCKFPETSERIIVFGVLYEQTD